MIKMDDIIEVVASIGANTMYKTTKKSFIFRYKDNDWECYKTSGNKYWILQKDVGDDSVFYEIQKLDDIIFVLSIND